MYSAFTAWGALNNRRAASHLVRLVEGDGSTPRRPPSKLGWKRVKSYCHLNKNATRDSVQKEGQIKRKRFNPHPRNLPQYGLDPEILLNRLVFSRASTLGAITIRYLRPLTRTQEFYNRNHSPPERFASPQTHLATN
ncbi:hypothetical protein TNCV_2623321 [Trichonephila clavipes]|nr:hypothetical protein TNCV_2623321 [Trichonephila clavipes]